MMKLGFTIFISFVAGFMSACGPKSRYRAVDVKTLKTDSTRTSSDTKVTEISATRPGLDAGLSKPEAPADLDSRRAIGEIEFVGVTRALRSDNNYGLDMFIKVKSGSDASETRLLTLIGSQSAIELEHVSLFQPNDTADKITDSKIKVEGACEDEKCEKIRVSVVNDKSKVNMTGRIDSKGMRITSADPNQTLTEKFKELIDKDVPVQNNLIIIPNPADPKQPTEFYTLAIGAGGGLVFTMEKKSATQNLQVISGRRLGIETANFSGTSDQFDLTLRDKKGEVLAKLRLGPIPSAPVAAGDACLKVKDSTEVLTLTCFKEVAAGNRVPETYSVKVQTKITAANPVRDFIYKVENAAEEKKLSIASEKTEEIVKSQKASAGEQFMIKSSDGKSKAAVVLSDECCKEQYNTTPAGG